MLVASLTQSYEFRMIMRPLFSNTLYKKRYPQSVETFHPLVSQKIKQLYHEMYDHWGNIKNINGWIKKIVKAAKKGNSDTEKLKNIEKYLKDSGYFQRRDKIKSAIEEFGWEPGFVYILTNKYMPNLIKVGRVFGKGKTAYDRIKDKDLNCTGVPYLFDVQFEIYTINSLETERQSHARLTGRVGTSEFFQFQSIESAKLIIIEGAKKVDNEAYKKSIGKRQMRFIF